MRAVTIHAHGDLDQLVYDEHFPDPRPGPGEVVVAVRATSLNYHDVFTLRGMPGIKIPMPAIMGLDTAGEVAEVGAGVEAWKPGDRVLVDPIDRVRGGLMGETVHGGLAERCRAAAHQLIRIPDGVSFAEAAALPVAYGTAHRMLVTQGRVAAGERVLILGASGGVGTCCVFLAKMAGATVVACASTEAKQKRLHELGADHVVDYAREDFAELTCGATAGFDPRTDIRYIWTFELQILGSNGWTTDDLVTLLGLVETRRLVPVIDRVLPLAETREGLRLLADREVIGKVVVVP
jgi:alcohol dehydrogenase